MSGLEPVRRAVAGGAAMERTLGDQSTPRVKSRRPLIGVDGNAFAIMGLVTRGLREAGATPDEIAAFQALATAGDYNALLRAAIAYTDEPWSDGDE